MDSNQAFKMIESIGVPIIIVDPSGGKICYLNEEMVDLSLYSREELLDRPINSLFCEESQKKLTSLLEIRPINSTMSIVDSEFTLIRKNKNRSSTSLYVKNNNGYLYITVTNNDPRKDLEKKLEDSYTQMIQTSKFISLAEMAGGIAHEINNPLAIIHAQAERMELLLVKGSMTPEKQNKSIEKIKKNTMRASKIIKNLKILSRNESDDDRAPLKVVTILDQTLELYQQRCRINDVDFQVVDRSDGAMIFASESQMLQVMVNLLENAIYEAQKAEIPFVKVEALVDGENIKIEITDSGLGVSSQIRENIMNPFFTTKPHGQGTGLGLSITRNIIERHSGNFVLDTTKQATCFSIALPIYKNENELIDFFQYEEKKAA